MPATNLSDIDVRVMLRLLNCENYASLFKEMGKRFGSEDGVELIQNWLTKNNVVFTREEKQHGLYSN